MYPSVKRLVDQFKVTNEEAVIIREYMAATDEYGWLYKDDLSNDACAALIGKTVYTGIEAIASLIPGASGNEYIPSTEDNNWDAHHGLDYVNMGDPYVPTIIFDEGHDTWRIASWGDIVEAETRRFGE